MEAVGVEFARQRRKQMRTWIETDPQRAWENRISWRERQGLPAAVQAELETLVSGSGNLDVFGATPKPGQTNDFRSVIRTATMDGRTYKAFVYGRRVNQPTATGVSLHGVALDGLVALSDSPVRLLDPSEPPTPGKKLAAGQCPVSGSNAAAAWAESGPQAYQLCSTEHVNALADMVWQEELQATTASPTTGAQAALVLIVDFPNAQGGNTTRTAALEAMQQVTAFYRDNSFGALSIEPVDVTPVLRMPQYSNTYLLGTANLLRDAIARAQALGYQTSNYRFLIVTFAEIGFPWGGLGTVGGNDSFIQGPTFRPDFVEHELGHNLGVWHAGGWLTDDESVIGPGRHIEYGNAFDVMGSGAGHLNGAFKSTVGWLQESNIATANIDGTYRIYAVDLGGELASGKSYTLRIPATPPLHTLRSDYWIDYRQQFVSLGSSSGALIHWATNSVGMEYSHLLDMNPAGPYGFADAALRIGRTFADNVRRICVTPIAKGPGWLDIAVKFAPSNASMPTLTLNASTLNANVGQPIQFTATATDSDGDALAYYWDFDDESVIQASLNQPSVTKSWSFAREYSVRCVVSDMKGAEAIASILVRIGTPATYHVSGTVASMPGVRVHNNLCCSDYRVTYTDSQGRFVLTGLPAGSYLLAAAKAGNSFKPLFPTPVTVGPTNVDGLQFDPRPPGAPYIGGFSPSSGGIGTLVTIDGANFFGLSSVTLGYLYVAFTYESSQRIQVRVPSEGVTGPITVSSAAGTDASSTAFMVIPSPPVITRQPQSQTNLYGYTSSASFFAAAEGTGRLTFQWRKDGLPIPGATNTNYFITPLLFEHAGVYEFVASNPLGSVTSNPARLTVRSAPIVIEPPQSTTVVLGDPAVFTVRAVGTPPLYYEWYRQDGFGMQPIPGAHDASYTTGRTEERDRYTRYFVVVTNLFGYASAGPAILDFLPPPFVEFFAPLSGTEVPIGRIEVTVRAYDVVPIESVELFYDTNKLAEAFQGEGEFYTLIFTNNIPGQRLSLTARATNNRGYQGLSTYYRDDPFEILLFLPMLERDAEWKFLDDGSDLGTNWRTTSFEDQSWKVGNGYFGFGGEWNDVDVPRTYVDFGEDETNKHVTTYFRRTLVAPGAAELSNVVLHATHLGGMIVYLNDREILRSAMPTGAVDYLTFATNGYAWDLRKRIDASLFVPGENQLAVEVHLASPDQESMLFNLRLRGDLPPGEPEISLVYPDPWTIATESPFEMLVDAFDVDGDITNVTFLVNDRPFGVLDTAPYSILVSNLPPVGYGSFRRKVGLQAFATDADGNSIYTWWVDIYLPSRPGYVNIFDESSLWNYDDSDVDSGTVWRDFPGPDQMPDWQWGYTPFAYPETSPSTIRFRKVFDLWVPLGVGSYSRTYTNLAVYLLTELSYGSIVYLNGNEVFRYNLPPGPITNGTYTGLPSSVYGYVRADIDPRLLRSTNQNILAVEIHKNQPDSDRFLFDCILVGMTRPDFPELRATRIENSLMLEWDWVHWYSVTLEQATSLDGPWYESYYQVIIEPDTQRFFRLRWEPRMRDSD